jgi:hypothetical protein
MSPRLALSIGRPTRPESVEHLIEGRFPSALGGIPVPSWLGAAAAITRHSPIFELVRDRYPHPELIRWVPAIPVRRRSYRARPPRRTCLGLPGWAAAALGPAQRPRLYELS